MVTKRQVAALLGKIQLIDRRQVDEFVLEEWFHILDGLEYEDCIQAIVEHRRNSTDYLLPAHVVQGAKRAAAERRKQERRYELELVKAGIAAGMLEGVLEDYEYGARKLDKQIAKEIERQHYGEN